MPKSNFYALIESELEYDMGDAAPYGYFQELLSEGFGDKAVAEMFYSTLQTIKIIVEDHIRTPESNYNSGPFLLASIPIVLGNEHYYLLPSLLGDGVGEIAPFLGLASGAVWNIRHAKNDGYMDAGNLAKNSLPAEEYFRFVGPFVPPKSLKGFDQKTVQGFIEYFLGFASRGVGRAILAFGLISFGNEISSLDKHLNKLWAYFLTGIAETIAELES